MSQDLLLPAELVRPGRSLGGEVIVKSVTGSTNDDARVLALSGAAHGTVVAAEEQTAGRGRRGRSWHSPSGVNLMFSIILGAPVARLHPGLVTISAGVAVARAVRRLCGVDGRIKWPNDVRAAGRKLCGTLAEAGGEDGGRWVILGLGLNVNLAREDLPPELAGIATSLAMETGREWPRAQVFHAVLDELEVLFDLLGSGRRREVLEPWQELAEVIDQVVRVDGPSGSFIGTAIGIREDGALMVCVEGQRVPVIAGDVTILEHAETEPCLDLEPG